MDEYRCTRDYVYRNPGCPGNKDLKSRQGHYLRANSQEHALGLMALKFPGDVDEGYGFTATLWKRAVAVAA